MGCNVVSPKAKRLIAKALSQYIENLADMLTDHKITAHEAKEDLKTAKQAAKELEIEDKELEKSIEYLEKTIQEQVPDEYEPR